MILQVGSDRLTFSMLCSLFYVLYKYRVPLFVICVPLILLPLWIVGDTQVSTCGYLVCIMALFWCTEIVPLAVTGMLPLIFLPATGIMTTSEVAVNYMKSVSILLIGSLLVALAVEKSELHKRISLATLKIFGANPKLIMLSFMAPTWMISMFISNTATTAIMLPITQAVLQQIEQCSNEEEETKGEENNSNKKPLSNKVDVARETTPLKKIPETVDIPEAENKSEKIRALEKAFTICVPYAATIGGTTILTGTTSNLIAKANVDLIWGHHGLPSPVTFVSWSIFALPISATLLLIVWAWLQFYFFTFTSEKIEISTDTKQKIENVIKEEHAKLGPMTYAETVVSVVFLFLVAIWFTREPRFISGWDNLFLPGYISDGVPAMVVAFVLFVIPSRLPSAERSEEPVEFLLDWHTVQHKMPWMLIFLIGGGLALAEASMRTGLGDWLGEQFLVLRVLPDWLVVFLVCLIINLLTELASNTAIASFMIPVVYNMAEEMGHNPLYLMLPVGITCSFAFMLPMATIPNAIAYATGKIQVKDMIKAGVLLNLICAIVVTIANETYVTSYFQLDILPWNSTNSTSRAEMWRS